MLQWSVRGQGLTAEHVGENGSKSVETVSVSHSCEEFLLQRGKRNGREHSQGKQRQEKVDYF